MSTSAVSRRRSRLRFPGSPDCAEARARTFVRRTSQETERGRFVREGRVSLADDRQSAKPGQHSGKQRRKQTDHDRRGGHDPTRHVALDLERDIRLVAAPNSGVNETHELATTTAMRMSGPWPSAMFERGRGARSVGSSRVVDPLRTISSQCQAGRQHERENDPVRWRPPARARVDRRHPHGLLQDQNGANHAHRHASPRPQTEASTRGAIRSAGT